MPNYCFYYMEVRGKKKDVDEFTEILKADYNYLDLAKIPERHFFRVFDKTTIDEGFLDANGEILEDYIGESDDYFMRGIDGHCAWSVNVCFLGTLGSYYDRFKETGFLIVGDEGEFRVPSHGTCLENETKRLNLRVEIDGVEGSFRERIIVENGVILQEDYIEN
jgi:hypothetical protein